MQKLIIKTLSFLPYPIARLPYDVAYFLILCAARILRQKCWARNSYYFNNIIPGLSDIDLTLFITPDSNKKRVHQFINLYTHLKKIIPFLGELNIYDAEDLIKIKNWVNWYEVRRDPKLSAYIALQKPQIGDRFIYLLRLLESDAHNLIKNPSLRHKKWFRHFQEVDLEAPDEITLPDLIHAISSSSPSNIPHGEIEEFLTYYLNHKQTETFNHLHREGEEKLFITLYPHRWLVAANGENKLRSSLESMHFSKEELGMIYAQLSWELNGLYSQKYTLPEESNLIIYIDMILNFLVLLRDSKEQDFIQLTDSFKYLKKTLNRN